MDMKEVKAVTARLNERIPSYSEALDDLALLRDFALAAIPVIEAENAALREQLAASRQEVEVQKAKAEKHYELGTEYFDLYTKAEREIAGLQKLLKIDAVITPREKTNERTD